MNQCLPQQCTLAGHASVPIEVVVCGFHSIKITRFSHQDHLLQSIENGISQGNSLRRRTVKDMSIRDPLPNEAETLWALASRSKSVWGYDELFLKTCAAELYPANLSMAAVAELRGSVVGFYPRCGAQHVGSRESESIPGRSLPLFKREYATSVRASMTSDQPLAVVP